MAYATHIVPHTWGVGARNKKKRKTRAATCSCSFISEVWGGFSPEAMRFLGELSQARNDGVDLERASATWSTSSFTSYHGQLLSLAVQWGVAIEIERAIKTSARFC